MSSIDVALAVMGMVKKKEPLKQPPLPPPPPAVVPAVDPSSPHSRSSSRSSNCSSISSSISSASSSGIFDFAQNVATPASASAATVPSSSSIMSVTGIGVEYPPRLTNVTSASNTNTTSSTNTTTTTTTTTSQPTSHHSSRPNTRGGGGGGGGGGINSLNTTDTLNIEGELATLHPKPPQKNAASNGASSSTTTAPSKSPRRGRIKSAENLAIDGDTNAGTPGDAIHAHEKKEEEKTNDPSPNDVTVPSTTAEPSTSSALTRLTALLSTTSTTSSLYTVPRQLSTTRIDYILASETHPEEVMTQKYQRPDLTQNVQTKERMLGYERIMMKGKEEKDARGGGGGSMNAGESVEEEKHEDGIGADGNASTVPQPPPDPPISSTTAYIDQGDSSFYHHQILVLRDSLQYHPRLIRWIQRYWSSFAHGYYVNYMTYKEYEAMHLRITKALFKQWKRRDAIQLCKIDWRRDTRALPGIPKAYTNSTIGGGGSSLVGGALNSNASVLMSYTHFSKSLFELVDLWTTTIDIEEYVDFLTILYARITVLVEKDIAPEPVKNVTMTTTAATATTGTTTSNGTEIRSHNDPAHHHNRLANSKMNESMQQQNSLNPQQQQQTDSTTQQQQQQVGELRTISPNSLAQNRDLPTITSGDDGGGWGTISSSSSQNPSFMSSSNSSASLAAIFGGEVVSSPSNSQQAAAAAADESSLSSPTHGAMDLAGFSFLKTNIASIRERKRARAEALAFEERNGYAFGSNTIPGEGAPPGSMLAALIADSNMKQYQHSYATQQQQQQQLLDDFTIDDDDLEGNNGFDTGLMKVFAITEHDDTQNQAQDEMGGDNNSDNPLLHPNLLDPRVSRHRVVKSMGQIGSSVPPFRIPRGTSMGLNHRSGLNSGVVGAISLQEWSEGEEDEDERERQDRIEKKEKAAKEAAAAAAAMVEATKEKSLAIAIPLDEIHLLQSKRTSLNMNMDMNMNNMNNLNSNPTLTSDLHTLFLSDLPLSQLPPLPTSDEECELDETMLLRISTLELAEMDQHISALPSPRTKRQRAAAAAVRKRKQHSSQQHSLQSSPRHHTQQQQQQRASNPLRKGSLIRSLTGGHILIDPEHHPNTSPRQVLLQRRKLDRKISHAKEQFTSEWMSSLAQRENELKTELIAKEQQFQQQKQQKKIERALLAAQKKYKELNRLDQEKQRILQEKEQREMEFLRRIDESIAMADPSYVAPELPYHQRVRNRRRGAGNEDDESEEEEDDEEDEDGENENGEDEASGYYGDDNLPSIDSRDLLKLGLQEKRKSKRKSSSSTGSTQEQRRSLTNSSRLRPTGLTQVTGEELEKARLERQKNEERKKAEAHAKEQALIAGVNELTSMKDAAVAGSGTLSKSASQKSFHGDTLTVPAPLHSIEPLMLPSSLAPLNEQGAFSAYTPELQMHLSAEINKLAALDKKMRETFGRIGSPGPSQNKRASNGFTTLNSVNAGGSSSNALREHALLTGQEPEMLWRPWEAELIMMKNGKIVKREEVKEKRKRKGGYTSNSTVDALSAGIATGQPSYLPVPQTGFSSPDASGGAPLSHRDSAAVARLQSQSARLQYLRRKMILAPPPTTSESTLTPSLLAQQQEKQELVELEKVLEGKIDQESGEVLQQFQHPSSHSHHPQSHPSHHHHPQSQQQQQQQHQPQQQHSTSYYAAMAQKARISQQLHEEQMKSTYNARAMYTGFNIAGPPRAQHIVSSSNSGSNSNSTSNLGQVRSSGYGHSSSDTSHHLSRVRDDSQFWSIRKKLSKRRILKYSAMAILEDDLSGTEGGGGVGMSEGSGSEGEEKDHLATSSKSTTQQQQKKPKNLSYSDILNQMLRDASLNYRTRMSQSHTTNNNSSLTHNNSSIKRGGIIEQQSKLDWLRHHGALSKSYHKNGKSAIQKTLEQAASSSAAAKEQQQQPQDHSDLLIKSQSWTHFSRRSKEEEKSLNNTMLVGKLSKSASQVALPVGTILTQVAEDSDATNTDGDDTEGGETDADPNESKKHANKSGYDSLSSDSELEPDDNRTDENGEEDNDDDTIAAFAPRDGDVYDEDGNLVQRGPTPQPSTDQGDEDDNNDLLSQSTKEQSLIALAQKQARLKELLAQADAEEYEHAAAAAVSIEGEDESAFEARLLERHQVMHELKEVEEKITQKIQEEARMKYAAKNKNEQQLEGGGVEGEEDDDPETLARKKILVGRFLRRQRKRIQQKKLDDGSSSTGVQSLTAEQTRQMQRNISNSSLLSKSNSTASLNTPSDMTATKISATPSSPINPTPSLKPTPSVATLLKDVEKNIPFNMSVSASVPQLTKKKGKQEEKDESKQVQDVKQQPQHMQASASESTVGKTSSSTSSSRQHSISPTRNRRGASRGGGVGVSLSSSTDQLSSLPLDSNSSLDTSQQPIRSFSLPPFRSSVSAGGGTVREISPHRKIMHHSTAGALAATIAAAAAGVGSSSSTALLHPSSPHHSSSMESLVSSSTPQLSLGPLTGSMRISGNNNAQSKSSLLTNQSSTGSFTSRELSSQHPNSPPSSTTTRRLMRPVPPGSLSARRIGPVHASTARSNGGQQQMHATLHSSLNQALARSASVLMGDDQHHDPQHHSQSMMNLSIGNFTSARQMNNHQNQFTSPSANSQQHQLQQQEFQWQIEAEKEKEKERSMKQSMSSSHGAAASRKNSKPPRNSSQQHPPRRATFAPPLHVHMHGPTKGSPNSNRTASAEAKHTAFGLVAFSV